MECHECGAGNEQEKAPETMKKSGLPGFAGRALLSFIYLCLVIIGLSCLWIYFGPLKLRALFDLKTDAIVIVVCLIAVAAGAAACLRSFFRKKRYVETAAATVCLALLYLLFVRPVVSPAPLAAFIPDDSTAFATVDFVDALGLFDQYVNALGRGRVQDLMAVLSKYGRGGKKVAGPGLSDLLKGWVGRDALFVAGDIYRETPDVAVYIRSRNSGKARQNFPEIVKMLMGSPVMRVAEGHAEAPESLGLTRLVFEDRTSRRGEAYSCVFEAGEGQPRTKKPLFCWASTRRALVIASSGGYLEVLMDSMNGKRTDKQRYFALMQKKGLFERRVALLFVNADRVSEDVARALKGSGAGKKLIGELDAVKGLKYTIGYKGLEIRKNISVLLDGNAVKSTEILKKIVSLKSSKHDMDRLIFKDGAAAYFSMNNVQNLLAMAKEADSGLEKRLSANYGFDAGALIAAAGEEAGITLLGVKPVKDEKGTSLRFDIVGALELNSDKPEAKNIYIEALRDAVRKLDNGSGRLVLTPKGGDVYEIETPGPGAGMRLVFGFTKKYAYFATSPAILREFMGNRKGGSTGIKSVAAAVINPARLAGDFRGYKVIDHVPMLSGMLGRASDEDRPALREFVNALNGLALALLNAVGITRMSLDSSGDKISLLARQDVSIRELRKFPLESIDKIAVLYLKIEQESEAIRGYSKQFDGCVEKLRLVRGGMEAARGLSDTGAVPAVSADGREVCRYILPGGASPEVCAADLKKKVESVCAAGSFSISRLNEMQYEIKARANGRNCCICVTEEEEYFRVGAERDGYAKCRKDAPCDCRHGMYFNSQTPRGAGIFEPDGASFP